METSLSAVREELRELSATMEAEKREVLLQAGESAQAAEKERSEEFRNALNAKEDIIRNLNQKLESVSNDFQKRYEKAEESNRNLLKDKYSLDTKNEQLQCAIESKDATISSLQKSIDLSNEKLKVTEGMPVCF